MPVCVANEEAETWGMMAAYYERIDGKNWPQMIHRRSKHIFFPKHTVKQDQFLTLVTILDTKY
jgi:hypothetical protein